MIDIIIMLAILVILVLVVWFLLTKLALPEPAGTIVQIAVVVIVAIVVIGILLNFRSGGFKLGNIRGDYPMAVVLSARA